MLLLLHSSTRNVEAANFWSGLYLLARNFGRIISFEATPPPAMYLAYEEEWRPFFPAEPIPRLGDRLQHEPIKRSIVTNETLFSPLDYSWMRNLDAVNLYFSQRRWEWNSFQIKSINQSIMKDKDYQSLTKSLWLSWMRKNLSIIFRIFHSIIFNYYRVFFLYSNQPTNQPALKES